MSGGYLKLKMENILADYDLLKTIINNYEHSHIVEFNLEKEVGEVIENNPQGTLREVELKIDGVVIFQYLYKCSPGLELVMQKKILKRAVCELIFKGINNTLETHNSLKKYLINIKP